MFEASVTPASAVNFELMLATQLLAALIQIQISFMSLLTALVETDLLIN